MILGSDPREWRERYRPLLGLLAVAFSPGLTATQLASIAGLTQSDTFRTLRLLAQILAGGWPDGPFRLFHESFRQWLFHTRNDFWVSPAKAHRDIGTYYLEMYPGDWHRADDYAVEHAPAHLLAAIQLAGEPEAARRQLHKLIELLTDPTFVDEKARRFGADAVRADLDAAASLPDLPDEIRERLSAAAAGLAAGPGRPAPARTRAGEAGDWDEPLATV